MFSQFQFNIDADGIATAMWDMPGRSMNVMTAQVLDELEALVEHVAGDAALKGCVIISGKEQFSGGADLTMLQGLRALQGEGEGAAQAFFDASRRLSVIFRRLETCGKPFVAAIHGVCLGGAFELALSCHYRVVSDAESTRLGLPEVKVGIFPGAGGTQRVPRLAPTPDALQMLLKGEQLRAAQAFKMNLIHAIVPRTELLAKAKDWIKAGGSPVAPWDRPDFKLPSGRVFSPAGMQIWSAANALYRRETGDNYPGARAILQSVYEGLQLPFDLGLRVESRYFAKILGSQQAGMMIRSLFVSMQELNKGARRPADIPPSPLKKIGILGAGFMGSGIAYVSALAGLEVVLLDQNQEAADKGKSLSHKLVSEQIMKGRTTEAAREALLSRIHAGTDYAALEGCDLVIEAVFEDPAIKADVISKAQKYLSQDCIFASNTSTLPISDLARHAIDAARFVGIHFFSPVEKMMLVEIIKGHDTGDKALAVALDYVRLLKKTPIVVNDARGFFTSRVVMTYVREGHLMLMEGVPPALIENAGKIAGMPVGPLALNDEVAIDLALKILRATKMADPHAVDSGQERLLSDMVETHDRLGRKNGKGFYDYEGKNKKLWPGLKNLQSHHVLGESIDVERLKQRFLVIQALETARIFEEGVLTDPREGDVGAILGFGFAPFTGGPLSYIDGMGAKTFVQLCDKLQQAHGPRFAPNSQLKTMAAQGEAFYKM